MIEVGDTVQDTISFGDDEVTITWDVIAVEPRDDGRFDVKLERTTTEGDIITTTMKGCSAKGTLH